MNQNVPERVIRLMERGVVIPTPHTVDIGSDVDLEKISGDGVVLHGGTRLAGEKTVLSAGVRLGEEGPVTVVNSRLGREVELKGGFFKDAVFLDRANFGMGAHVREGCLIEEEAGGAHTVGLKQTILFPFVTLGSLVNFCDCLMAGGTSRKDHSEVGSSYIHFNYTPNQDKATASLLGDVPRGVMLRERPIFLGGQGGLVGPARVGYGAVVAAGTILREDVEEGQLVQSPPEAKTAAKKPFIPGYYADPDRIINNNIMYMASLVALDAWYRHARRPFFEACDLGQEVLEGALEMLKKARSERLKRMEDLAEKMGRPLEIPRGAIQTDLDEAVLARRKVFCRSWPAMKEFVGFFDADGLGAEERARFLAAFHGQRKVAGDYIEAVRSLDDAARAEGIAWLEAVVETFFGGARAGME